MAIDPSQIRQYLSGVNFPVSKEDLADMLRDKGASDEVVSFMQNLPMDEINSPGDVFKAINPQD